MSLRERSHDQEWLNGLLVDGGRWAEGPVEIAGDERIGLGYGLSGEIRRLHLRSSSGEPGTLVAKIEDAARRGGR